MDNESTHNGANTMDAIIALLISYATAAATAAAEAAELAHPTTPTTWVCNGFSNATADAYNAELDSVATEACKAYYEVTPDGHWDDAFTMQTAIRSLRVQAPRECAGRCIY